MQPKRTQKPPKTSANQSPFTLPIPEWSHEEEVTALVSRILATKTVPFKDQPLPDTDYLKAAISIANNFWRAKKRMVDQTTGEVREEMKRIHRDVEAIRRSLAEVGMVILYYRDDDFREGEPRIRIVVRDHTRDLYDEGQPMKVVASRPTPGLDKKRVSETLLPSIFWNDHLVQNGEIEIETPPPLQAPNEAQHQTS